MIFKLMKPKNSVKHWKDKTFSYSKKQLLNFALDTYVQRAAILTLIQDCLINFIMQVNNSRYYGD